MTLHKVLSTDYSGQLLLSSGLLFVNVRSDLDARMGHWSCALERRAYLCLGQDHVQGKAWSARPMQRLPEKQASDVFFTSAKKINRSAFF